jgi:hypothetical protein
MIGLLGTKMRTNGRASRPPDVGKDGEVVVVYESRFLGLKCRI